MGLLYPYNSNVMRVDAFSNVDNKQNKYINFKNYNYAYYFTIST